MGLSDALKKEESNLNKMKKQCLKQLENLKECFNQMEVDVNVVKKRAKKKEQCYKLFCQYEKEHTKFQDLRNKFWNEDVPNKLSDLNDIELSRLTQIQNGISKFVELIDIYVAEIVRCQKEATQCSEDLDQKKDYNDCITGWIDKHGKAPEIPDVPFGLPYTAKDIYDDKFVTPDSEGGRPHTRLSLEMPEHK